MVGVCVGTGDYGLNLSGIYLFDSQAACYRWQYEQLVAAGVIREANGMPVYRDEVMGDWHEALMAVRADYEGCDSFFRILDVQQGMVHA